MGVSSDTDRLKFAALFYQPSRIMSQCDRTLLAISGQRHCMPNPAVSVSKTPNTKRFPPDRDAMYLIFKQDHGAVCECLVPTRCVVHVVMVSQHRECWIWERECFQCTDNGCFGGGLTARR